MLKELTIMIGTARIFISQLTIGLFIKKVSLSYLYFSNFYQLFYTKNLSLYFFKVGVTLFGVFDILEGETQFNA